MTRPRAVALAAALALAVPALAAAQMAPPASSPSPASPASPLPSPTGSPSPAPLANTLKWSTASEVDNFGYDVYRAEKEDGPFTRINAKPIPGAGTLDEPRFYQYVDADIDPTKGYYYYVESISLKGVREKFTPVIKAAPKRPLAGSPSAPPSPSATAYPPILPPSPPPGGRK